MYSAVSSQLIKTLAGRKTLSKICGLHAAQKQTLSSDSQPRHCQTKNNLNNRASTSNPKKSLPLAPTVAIPRQNLRYSKFRPNADRASQRGIKRTHLSNSKTATKKCSADSRSKCLKCPKIRKKIGKKWEKSRKK